MRIIILTIVLLAASAIAAGQTPTPTATPVYKTYAEAMAAGKAAFEKGTYPVAEVAYDQAANKAANDDQRYDALIKRGGALEKTSRTDVVGGTKYAPRRKVVVRFQDAVAAYTQAAELPGISVEKKAEAMMLIGDIYSSTYKSEYLPSKPLFGDSWKASAREEFTKVINLPNLSANTKARALIARANAYTTTPTFGRFDNNQVAASGKDLETAAMTEGATDKIKADALLDLAELALRIKDVNTYFGALDKITTLPAAEPNQKVGAYDALARLLIDNSKLLEARKAVADGLAIPKGTAADRAALYRDLAYIQLVDPANKSADGQKALKLADAELDKAVKAKGLTQADKVKMLIAFGEFFQVSNVPIRTDLAVLQYQKVLALKGLTVKDIAMAQYGVGEAYRYAGRNVEAKAAYEKVSKENGQYYGYAQHQIKAMAQPTQITNMDDDEDP